jgi:hypothetical protein
MDPNPTKIFALLSPESWITKLADQSKPARDLVKRMETLVQHFALGLDMTWQAK